MPCRVDPTPEEIRRSRESAEARRQKEKDQLLVLTQTACWAMKELIKERAKQIPGPQPAANKDARLSVLYALEREYGKDHVKWWKQHEKNDAARFKREQAAKVKADLKKNALAKLNKAEREALGL